MQASNRANAYHLRAGQQPAKLGRFIVRRHLRRHRRLHAMQIIRSRQQARHLRALRVALRRS